MQLAKSLHTVTVLVNLARHFVYDKGLSHDAALMKALVTLGYEPWAIVDSHGIIRASREKLSKVCK